jgi:hypothetical protein
MKLVFACTNLSLLFTKTNQISNSAVQEGRLCYLSGKDRPMKLFLLLIFSFGALLLRAQTNAQLDPASPKPSITIDGVNCPIGNTIYSCVPKTCNTVTIYEGDSVEFCTNNEIYLNTDTAYWMQWNFTGSNYSSVVTNAFPSATPICYFPKWTVAGTYTVNIFYNGWLSAYPTSDCWTFGPSQWIITVDVLTNTGIASPVDDELECEIFPNPGNGIFNMKFSNPENVKAMYVTDMLGKEILRSPTKRNST